MLKKIIAAACLLMAVLAVNITANAALIESGVGNIGFFGGITEGARLPKTTELLLKQTAKKTTTVSYVYKELFFITGTPVEITGTMSVKSTGSVTDTADYGTYKVTYDVRPTATTDVNTITRNITFNVNWRREGDQIIKDYSIASWVETIKIGNKTYKVDAKQSKFTVGTLEDICAGATYYKGTISMFAVYLETANNKKTTVQSEGSIYGYNCAWSSTETQLTTTQIVTDEWQMQYQIKPSVSLGKTLLYSQNAPTAISFSGNFIELMQNQSSMTYEITVLPNQFYLTPVKGTAYLTSFNEFEQLAAKDTSVWQGNFAEADINKLFAMSILDGDPRYFAPNQGITRSEFITMLVKAVKLPIEPAPVLTSSSKKPVTVNIVFPDVMPERADYPYIMAAYESKLAIGRGSGHFQPDSGIEREELVVLLVRALGLSNLGLEPTPVTPYADDGEISSWAKKEIYAATRINLISADDYGNIYPHQIVSKGEAAALIVRMIDYMRYELQMDYIDHITKY